MTSNQQGTRIYYAPAGTAWVALAAGVAPSGTFIQVTGGINVKVTPHEVDKWDPNPLEATTPGTQIALKPGNATFSIDEHDTISPTLRGFCDNQTKKMWAFLNLDGTAETGDGYLTCQSALNAQKGDYKARVTEDYTVNGTGIFTRQAHA